MRKPRSARLVKPAGVKIERHVVGTQVDGSVMHTIQADGFKKLIAVELCGQYVWLHKDFSG